MEDQITVNFVAYTFLILGIGVAFGWFMRQIVYNMIRDAMPKKKTRVKRVKATAQLPESPTDDGSIAV